MPSINEYEAKIAAEQRIFNDMVNVHDLPEIFHYWSNRFIRPLGEAYGFSNPDQLFAKYILQSCARCCEREPSIISIGTGNCETELRVAQLLRQAGQTRFKMTCLDLNANMLQRGKIAVAPAGLEQNFIFVQGDFNAWKADAEYDAVMANQSLHHVTDLEGLFDEIGRALKPEGSFIISDIIGRNGHQRWPEALPHVQRFWKMLPDKYHYNHSLKRDEPLYENWDCSSEGFEGIRAQDILPELLKRFYFPFFFGFGNVIDVFVDRCFGHNFDANSDSDRAFIDMVHECDENGFEEGTLTPTHMFAVLTKVQPESQICVRGLSPEQSVRK